MKRIGIISDTHSWWDDKYLKYFEPCDEIWHAGDIGSMEVAEKLAAFRTLRAVCGNCDGGDLRLMYPEKLRFKCEDVDVLMKHIGGYPGNYDQSIRSQIYAMPPQLFISGHSHILKVKYDKTLNLLHINPGAAGMQGWHKERTLVRLTIDGSKFTDCELHDVDVGHLVMSADIIYFALASIAHHKVDSLAVVLHIKPVAHVVALAVYRQFLSFEDIVYD